MLHREAGLVVVCGLFAFASVAGAGSHTLGVEAGWVFPGYNDVRIPGDTGTKVSLTEDLSSNPFPAWRLRYSGVFSGRHEVTALAAFLTMESDGVVGVDVVFDDAVFAAGSRVESTFRFNSYRAGYRYLLCNSQRFRLGAGGCLKVRDAAIELRDAASSSEKTDLGFVPLLSLSAAWVVRPGIRILAELDGLAAPQGRAEDLLLAVEARINDVVSAYAGYRLLEGGADNDEVYTFSLFQYAVAGVSVRL